MPAQINREMLKIRPFKVPGRIFSWLFVEGRPLTTKGRWINKYVKRFFDLYQLFPAHRNSYRPIFIVGSGRSGTTVLGSLFAIHKDTVFLNEPKLAWNYICPNEDLIGSYSEQNGVIRLSELDVNSDMASRLSRIYSSAMRVGLAKRVVDKYPELIYRTPFVKKIFPESKLIAIVRDGVDTCVSIKNWSKFNGTIDENKNVHDWWGLNDRKWNAIVDELICEIPELEINKSFLRQCSDHLDRAAIEWIVSTRESLRVAKLVSDVLYIRYEDLCENTDRILREMLDHCDLGEDRKFTSYANSILGPAKSYGTIALAPQIVTIFQETLQLAGYSDSVGRVVVRG